jgi:alpha-galactosidase
MSVESVASFVASGIEGPAGAPGEVDLWWVENDWLGESRWQHRLFRDALPDLNRRVHGGDSRVMFRRTSEGSWSFGGFLPMGAAVNRRTSHAWRWQIEHNGAWHGRLGEHSSTSGEHTGRQARADCASRGYVALLGPTDAEHRWRLVLEPGESFETVPAVVALSGDGLEGAVARLTRYRRVARRAHPDHERLAVIFNDYMNTLMGEPTTDRLLRLVSAASNVGAEVFCIDSGWYAELGQSWWETVGAWRPSASRFPNGIVEVLDAISAHGMVPGLCRARGGRPAQRRGELASRGDVFRAQRRTRGRTGPLPKGLAKIAPVRRSAPSGQTGANPTPNCPCRAISGNCPASNDVEDGARGAPPSIPDN